MQSLVSGNTQVFTFSQLNGMRFLGPMRGVFPIGPDGISNFNTLQSVSPSETQLGYNYSLELQGITGNVSCSYDTSTPIVLAVDPTLDLPVFSATCPTGEPLTNVTAYPIPANISTLGAWICKADPSSTSYTLYLSGNGNYLGPVGSMTCSISDVQLATYNVTYYTNGSQFVVPQNTFSVSNVSSTPVDRSVYTIYNTVGEAQAFLFNSLAESVISWRARNFGQGLTLDEQYAQNDTYLRLFEATIQGIIEYEVRFVCC
jgi:hypothetical protein